MTQNPRTDAGHLTPARSGRLVVARNWLKISDRTAWASQFYDPAARRENDRFSAILHVELEEYAPEVGFYRVFGNREGAGDLLVRRAGGDAAKHLEFTFAEGGLTCVQGDLLRDFGENAPPSGINFADRIEELAAKAAFEEIPRSPGFQGARRLNVPVICRENNYLGFRVTLANRPNCRFAVLPRHLHVEQHDIGAQLIVAFEGLDAVSAFANDLDVALRRQKSDDALSQHRMIVDDQNPYRSHENPTNPTPLARSNAANCYKRRRQLVDPSQCRWASLTHLGDRIALQPGVTASVEAGHYRSMERPLRRNRSPAGDAASLILRVSLTITLGILSVSSDTASTPLSVTAAILGCLIGSGLLTRGAAAASVGLVALCDHTDLIALLSIAAEALSLVLVGAGAWSLDALFFYKLFPGWSNRA